MGMTSPFPEPDSPDLAPYAVYSRAEIIGLLKAMGGPSTLTTVYFDQHAGFAVTALLAVNPDFEEVVFDAAADELAQRRLLAAESLTFVTFIEHIKVQFSARRAEATQHDGHPAFRVRLPEQVLRLQRRDFYRVRTPLSRPAHCLVPYGDDGRQYEKLRLIDISVGGVAVLAQPEKFELAAGTRVDDCFLDLPGIGSVGVSLQVRHQEALPRDDQARSVGCEFVEVAPLARTLIQRYVNKLDAERRKLETAGPRAA
jgi:c-di-GMP-binding flagellar brake protein YcgR